MKSLEFILVEATVVCTVSEFLNFFLEDDWSDLNEIVIEVVSLMMMSSLVSDLVHVFTFDLDPFVYSTVKSTIMVSCSSISVVILTIKMVECGLMGVVCSFCFSSSSLGLSIIFVDDSLFARLSNFTGFLLSLLNSIVIISSSGSALNLRVAHWIVGDIHGSLISLNISLSHNLTNWLWSSWLWKNDFLIDTVKLATFDELDMSVWGVVETVNVSMCVGNSSLVGLLSLLSKLLVLLLIIFLMSECSGDIDSLVHFTIFIFDGRLVLSKMVSTTNLSSLWELSATVSIMNKSISSANSSSSLSNSLGGSFLSLLGSFSCLE